MSILLGLMIPISKSAAYYIENNALLRSQIKKKSLLKYVYILYLFIFILKTFNRNTMQTYLGMPENPFPQFA